MSENEIEELDGSEYTPDDDVEEAFKDNFAELRNK